MTEHADGIVVGVDGSEASVAALRWAAEQARALGTPVVAVHAWEPATAGFAPYAPASARPTVSEQRERAAEVLASAVRQAFGPRVGPDLRAVVAEGPAARVLLRYARGALLLVLGRRAHGQWELPAVGTVGRDCLRHATVPVVTVPAPDRHAARLRAVGTTPDVRTGAA
ncbi:Nucleotide-binding universal stress protein, UspA family [Streptomyces sp. cf386]|uniref:universal stress protein n=1 Tax=Streptomyces sp. cf386 TaxID=1761904 RepID=UPI000885085D|nr:universal stress protein [Streptomyces sp. cf386]SDN48348.1 Nucleotide-binding universal stress protein, UspA family [Streptomyces sp. cf386]